MTSTASLRPGSGSSSTLGALLRQDRSRPATIIQTALTPAVWGTTYAVTTELLPAERPLLAATVRALPVGLVLVAYGRKLPHGTWWCRAAVLGLLNIGAFFALLFVAAFRLPGGLAATVGATQPLIAAWLGSVALREPLLLRTVTAGCVGIAGVAMLVFRGSGDLDVIGVAAALTASVSMAGGVVLNKRWGMPTTLLTYTGWQLSLGGMALLPLCLVVEGLPSGVSGANGVGFAWLALIGTGLAYANWFRGVQALSVATASSLCLVSPVVAVALGWLLLGEQLTMAQGAGAVLVMAAVVGQATTSAHPREAA
jgi:probable blue pigment (indigoidine) exporter